MLASDARAALSPFGYLTNKAALSPTYRALHLSKMAARGCSAFGLMEVIVDLGITEPACVSSDALVQILRSAPEGEFVATNTDKAISWKCGAARGVIAVLGDKIEIPEFDENFSKAEFGTRDTTFADRIELGSLGCGSTAFKSVGLYGIALDNRGPKLLCYSTDDTTMASIVVGDRLPGFDGVATLSPDAMKLLISVASRGTHKIALDATSLRFCSDDTRLLLKQVSALRHDIGEMLTKFTKAEVSLDLDRSVIMSFVRRAEALSEERGQASVQISVDEGATKLAFAENTSSSEQFYLVEGAADISVTPITLRTRTLAKALAHSDKLVFDYADKGILALRGPDDFVFIISGKKTTSA